MVESQDIQGGLVGEVQLHLGNAAHKQWTIFQQLINYLLDTFIGKLFCVYKQIIRYAWRNWCIGWNSFTGIEAQCSQLHSQIDSLAMSFRELI